MGTFQMRILLHRSATTSTRYVLKTIESFQMRYYVKFYLKGHQKYQMSYIWLFKFTWWNRSFLFVTFDFDFWWFRCPLREKKSYTVPDLMIGADLLKKFFLALLNGAFWQNLFILTICDCKNSVKRICFS